jgi:hypothetical protein
MLRGERPRSLAQLEESNRVSYHPRDLLFAVAPPPKTHSSSYSGWPNWLIPAYRSGGHRPHVQLLEDER